jgi:O-antigen ligase
MIAGTATMPSPSSQGREARLPRYKVDPLWGAIAVSIIVGISRIHQHFGPLMVIRPAMLSFLVAVGYSLLVPSALRTATLRETWHWKALVVIGICAIMSIPFGISMGAAGSFFLNSYISLLVYTFLMVLAVRNWRDLKFLVFVFLVADALLLYLCLFVFGSQLASSGIDRLTFDYSYDANDVCVILVMSVPMAVFMLYSARGFARLFYLLILGGTIFAIALTGSRGGMVGLAAVSVSLFLAARDVKLIHRLGLVGMFIVILILAAPPGYWKQMQTILDPKDDYNITSDYGRVEIMKRGLTYVARYPIFGVGISNFGRAEGSISARARNAPPGEQIMWTAPHNTSLQVAAEIGLIAFSAWMAVIIAGTVGLFRTRGRLPKSWRYGSQEQRFLYQMTVYLPVAFIGFFVNSFFVSWAYLDAFYLLFVMLTGLHVATRQCLARVETGVPTVPQPVRGMMHWRLRQAEMREAIGHTARGSETLS